MPSPIISGAPSTVIKANDSKPSTSKARRPVRRRGRGRGDMSDEELEREALTDSGESQLSMDSDSESDEEVAPSKAQANGAALAGAAPQLERPSAPSSAPKSLANGPMLVIPASTNWSDMVTADEEGTSKLPVVDFKDLDKLNADPTVATHDSPSTSILTPAQLKAGKQKAKRKAKKEKLNSVTSTPAASEPSTSHPAAPAPEPEPTTDVPAPSVSTSTPATPIPPSESSRPPRPPKVNARQAYLDRLTNDPSYVPRVGAFWGHDDRLMDKELRSMSPWWRGRGRGGPRGRGGFSSAGNDGTFRGRGGFAGRGRGTFPDSQATNVESSNASQQPPVEPQSRPPSVSQTANADSDNWSRSGPMRGHWSEARGRGGMRGRGFGRGTARAGAPANPTPRPASATTQPTETSSKPTPVKAVPRGGRKPERAWTKPLDNSLIANADGSATSARRKPTVAPSSPASSDVRIKLPGTSSSTSVPVTADVLNHKRSSSCDTDPGAEQNSEAGSTSKKPKPAVVKLPSRHKVQVSVSVAVAASAAARSTQHVKSPFATEVTLPSHTENVNSSDAAVSDHHVAPHVEEKDPFVVHMPPDEARADIVRQSLNSTVPSSSSPTVHATPVAASEAPSSRPESAGAGAPPFAPTYQPPPPLLFSNLPPGVAYGDNGMLFEVATGRPVILAPPQPVPSMFHPPPRIANPYASPFTPRQFTQTPPAGTPPPLLPVAPYGGNGYPMGDSPGYSPYPLDMPTMDPSAPIFVPARSSAVEIRAPSVDAESAGGKSSTTTSASSSVSAVNSTGPKSTKPSSAKQPSNLRTSVSASMPDGMQGIPKEDVAIAQSPYATTPYPNGGYYHPGYPGPEYAVYAPVPIGMDGQPQYGAFYPDAQYAMSPYGEPNPYAGYGTVYYGHGGYNAPQPGDEMRYY